MKNFKEYFLKKMISLLMRYHDKHLTCLILIHPSRATYQYLNFPLERRLKCRETEQIGVMQLPIQAKVGSQIQAAVSLSSLF